ncbi:hypothetical protein ABIB90_007896 [Bradyrhizobium sp. JR4.1]
MPTTSVPSATLLIQNTKMRLWGPEQFDPNVIDRKALEAAVNTLSGIWNPRRRTTRSK